MLPRTHFSSLRDKELSWSTSLCIRQGRWLFFPNSRTLVVVPELGRRQPRQSESRSVTELPERAAPQGCFSFCDGFLDFLTHHPLQEQPVFLLNCYYSQLLSLPCFLSDLYLYFSTWVTTTLSLSSYLLSSCKTRYWQHLSKCFFFTGPSQPSLLPWSIFTILSLFCRNDERRKAPFSVLSPLLIFKIQNHTIFWIKRIYPKIDLS